MTQLDVNPSKDRMEDELMASLEVPVWPYQDVEAILAQVIAVGKEVAREFKEPRVATVRRWKERRIGEMEPCQA